MAIFLLLLILLIQSVESNTTLSYTTWRIEGYEAEVFTCEPSPWVEGEFLVTGYISLGENPYVALAKLNNENELTRKWYRVSDCSSECEIERAFMLEDTQFVFFAYYDETDSVAHVLQLDYSDGEVLKYDRLEQTLNSFALIATQNLLLIGKSTDEDGISISAYDSQLNFQYRLNVDDAERATFTKWNQDTHYYWLSYSKETGHHLHEFDHDGNLSREIKFDGLLDQSYPLITRGDLILLYSKVDSTRTVSYHLVLVGKRDLDVKNSYVLRHRDNPAHWTFSIDSSGEVISVTVSDSSEDNTITAFTFLIDVTGFRVRTSYDVELRRTTDHFRSHATSFLKDRTDRILLSGSLDHTDSYNSEIQVAGFQLLEFKKCSNGNYPADDSKVEIVEEGDVTKEDYTSPTGMWTRSTTANHELEAGTYKPASGTVWTNSTPLGEVIGITDICDDHTSASSHFTLLSSICLLCVLIL